MNAEQLVRETMALTGSSAPQIMDENSPALEDAGAEQELYLIGLIGGKEVGKSALVNALAGDEITEQTSHGPGTQIAIAYAHRARQAELAAMLEQIVPGKFRIVLHDNDRLAHQVLLDLPDIDSRFSQHLEITRRTLRHMLFPIWIQSVEKYADAQPQQLLARVAAGNDPGNFLFCLNKVDQLPSGNGPATDLRDDYAKRIARVLQLPTQPRVFMISAIRPADFDLPELVKLLSREKSEHDLQDSRKRAIVRRQRSLLSWLDSQDLPERAAQLERLEDQATDLLSQRVGVPLLERAVPSILDDAAYRLILTDGVFAKRVNRWPVVNVLHAVLSPLRMLVRENASATGTFFNGAQRLVDGHLAECPQSLARGVQSAFAQLHQSNPNLAALYEQNKLWETMQAEHAEGRLKSEMAQTIDLQRKLVMEKLSGKAGVIAPLFRVLLTIGALIWFPLIQPVLHLVLTTHSPWKTAADVGMLLVEIFSSESLLHNAVFLILWYLLIWSLLRWDTRRRVDNLLARWKSTDAADPELNLATVALAWMDDLLQPIRSAKTTVNALAKQIESLRSEINS